MLNSDEVIVGNDALVMMLLIILCALSRVLLRLVVQVMGRERFSGKQGTAMPLVSKLL